MDNRTGTRSDRTNGDKDMNIPTRGYKIKVNVNYAKDLTIWADSEEDALRKLENRMNGSYKVLEIKRVN